MKKHLFQLKEDIKRTEKTSCYKIEQQISKLNSKTRRYLLLIPILILASCTTNSIDSREQTQKNKEIVKQYFDHFNNHNWQEMAEMYTAIAEFKDPSIGIGIFKLNQSEITMKYAGLGKIIPDIHDNIIQMYPSDENHIIVEFVSSGTAPDGSSFELPICTIFTIENSKITKDYSYFDNSEN